MQNLTQKGDLGACISSRTFHEKIEITFQAQMNIYEKSEICFWLYRINLN